MKTILTTSDLAAAADLTPRERGLALRRLWSKRREVVKDKKSFKEWVREEGLGKIKDCEFLVTLVGYDWADPIWALVDDGYILYSAYNISREVRHKSRTSGRPASEILGEVLEGFKDRRKWQVSRPKRSCGRWSYVRVKATPERHVEGEAVYEVSTAKELWGAVRVMGRDFLKKQLPTTISEAERNELLDDFEFGMRAVFESLVKEARKRRLRSRQLAASLVGQTKLRLACECLRIPVPKKGELIDMDEARKKYWVLARRFHPDRNGSSEGHIKQYHAANEAWDVVKAYMEERNV